MANVQVKQRQNIHAINNILECVIGKHLYFIIFEKNKYSVVGNK